MGVMFGALKHARATSFATMLLSRPLLELPVDDPQCNSSSLQMEEREGGGGVCVWWWCGEEGRRGGRGGVWWGGVGWGGVGVVVGRGGGEGGGREGGGTEEAGGKAEARIVIPFELSRCSAAAVLGVDIILLVRADPSELVRHLSGQVFVLT